MSRIAIIDHVGEKAGMDYYSGLLASSLAAKGVECFLFSNFTVKEKNIQSFRYFIGHTSSKIKKITNHFTAFWRSAVQLRRSNCNNVIVHIFSYDLKEIYALGVLRSFGIHVIGIVHDVESFSKPGKHRSRKFILEKLIDKLVVHNKYSAQQILHIEPALENKMTIIPHGNFHSLFLDTTSRQAARNKLGLKDHLKYLLFFGQIKTVKGLDVLIKALPQLPSDVHLIIAGKPWKHDFDAYEILIKQLGVEDRITKMIRFIKDDERDILFRAADILILPYKQIFQSGVMLMAMSARTPIIASDLKPMKELILQHETGFLFKSEDEQSLANIIKEVINEPLLLNEVSNNAWQATKEKNNWNAIASNYISLINENCNE